MVSLARNRAFRSSSFFSRSPNLQRLNSDRSQASGGEKSVPRTTTVARVECWPSASWGACSGLCRAWRVAAAGLGKKEVGAYLPCVNFKTRFVFSPTSLSLFLWTLPCPEKGRDTDRVERSREGGRKKEEQDGLFGWLMRTALDSYSYTQFVVVNVDFVSSRVCQDQDSLARPFGARQEKKA